MSAYDKNKIFFGLIHYILSEQSNVNWILKTSLVNFTGLNTTINDKKYKQTSLTDDIIQYIYQVKPYHVQFEQFIEKYSSKKEEVNVEAEDSNDITINFRLDAVQPYADFDEEIYEVTSKYPDSESYNVDGLKIFNTIDKAFYIRRYDNDDGIWYWELSDEKLITGKYYLNKALNNLYQAVKDGETLNLFGVSNAQLIALQDTHMANRLWLLKYKYFNKDELNDYITDMLNCHFKGITVDGAALNMDTMGYDAFLYDEKLYDAPTLSAIYCLINPKETGISFKYTKDFVKVGLQTLEIKSETEILEGNCTVTYQYKNESGTIDNFSIKNNLLNIYRPIRQYEKITVVSKIGRIRTGFIFVGHPFVESIDDDTDTQIRRFENIGTTSFPIPDGDIGSRKVTVYLIMPNGSKRVTTNIERDGSNIIVNEELLENMSVQITVIDYRQIYDKIYTWEDCYGQSNNNVILEGDRFLRPEYEKDRPAELVASYPLNGVMIYTYEGNDNISSVYNINWKDNHDKLPLSKTLMTTLVKDLNIGDRTIEVANMDILMKPTVNVVDEIIPAKIIVNSEIIEYHDYEVVDGKGILKNIRRASSGSYLNQYLPAGTEVYVYNEQASKSYDNRISYINTLFREGMENKFNVPNEYKKNENIVVYKKPHIKLLTDIKMTSTYFDIDSDNVTLPTENKLGHLYINDDKIYFKTITPRRNSYRITDFSISKEYSAADSVIYAAQPVLLNESEYKIVIENPRDEMVDTMDGTHEVNYKDVYVVLNEQPKPFEVIIVGNQK